MKMLVSVFIFCIFSSHLVRLSFGDVYRRELSGNWPLAIATNINNKCTIVSYGLFDVRSLSRATCLLIIK